MRVAVVRIRSGRVPHEKLPDFAVDVQLARFGIMAVSAVAFAAFGSLAIERSLRRAGVLRERSA